MVAEGVGCKRNVLLAVPRSSVFFARNAPEFSQLTHA
jgi:hypothetical protein